MRGVVPLLSDVISLLIECAREKFSEISQQVLEDNLIPQLRVLQFLQFEFHKL